MIGFSVLLVAFVAPVPAGAEARFAEGQSWGVEIGFGGGWLRATAYTDRLEAFGYERDNQMHFRWSLAVEKIVLPYFSVLLQTNLLDSQHWDRPSGIGPDDQYDWGTWTLDAHARAFVPVANGEARFYGQVGVGPTFTSTRLRVRTNESEAQTTHEDLQVRYNVIGLLGFEVLMGPHVAFFLQGGYAYAPAPRNRLGDVHRGGGLLIAGLGTHFGRRR